MLYSKIVSVVQCHLDMGVRLAKNGRNFVSKYCFSCEIFYGSASERQIYKVVQPSILPQVTDSGTPLVRRLDLSYPHLPEARNSSQYLLGDALLVAPVDPFDGIPTKQQPAGPYNSNRRVWFPPGYVHVQSDFPHSTMHRT